MQMELEAPPVLQLSTKRATVGMVFDKNQVPEIFDCMYENQIGRTIHVDIQYILLNLFLRF